MKWCFHSDVKCSNDAIASFTPFFPFPFSNSTLFLPGLFYTLLNKKSVVVTGNLG